MLNPTDDERLPLNQKDKLEDKFFNFFVDNYRGPLINGIDNELPADMPFVNDGDEKVKNESLFLTPQFVKTRLLFLLVVTLLFAS